MQNNTAKILIVDDEELIRIGCQRILEDLGYQADLAENGQIGLEKIKANSYDLALIDLKMPLLDGMELLDEIKKIGRSQPLISIIITAYATIETAVNAIKKGAYDYLPKPFMPEDLIAKVNRGLEKRKLLLETEGLRAEREKNLLEISNGKSRTRTILDSMSEGMIVTNYEGQIALVNPAVKKMLRLGETGLIGNSIHALGITELEDSVNETLKAGISIKKIRRTEFSRDQRAIQCNINAITADGACIGAVAVLIDITEEKKIEQLKTDFLRMVSHELKAPIGVIEGYLNLILEGYTADNPQKEKEIIKKSRDKAGHLIELVNDLLDLSRTERKVSKKIERIDLVQILREVIEFYQNQAQEKFINIGFDSDKDIYIEGNREDLSRLFGNLVNNAIKYTHKNGKVFIKGNLHPTHIIVAVQDTGIGINPEDREKIFQEFYRTETVIKSKISGTGLGLSIARKIAEDHNGYIAVESQLHKGSTFKVIFPVE